MADRHAPDMPTSDEAAGAAGRRSGYGTLPGGEFPRAVYTSILGAFACILAASWLAFGRTTEADLALAIAGVLAILFFGLPIIMCRAARARAGGRRKTVEEFFGSGIETATGRLTGAEAWLQVLVIPMALAFAAAAFATVFIAVA